MYSLNRNELRALKAICEGTDSIQNIAEAVGISKVSAYRAAASLSSSRLAKAAKDGKSIRISPSHYGHSHAICSYLVGSRRSADPLIGSRLLVLLSVSSNPKTLERVGKELGLAKESVRRIAWTLRQFGAISLVGGSASIPSADLTLARFLKDFSKGACEAKLESIERTGTMLWSEGLEFVFSARKTVDAPGVSETGITAMSRKGIRFVSDARYYHYAYWKQKLTNEEIALHQILVDPASARNLSYGILFLMKAGYRQAYLERLGQSLEIGTLTGQIVRFLEGKAVDNPQFPSKSDMSRLRNQYGVPG